MDTICLCSPAAVSNERSYLNLLCISGNHSSIQLAFSKINVFFLNVFLFDCNVQAQSRQKKAKTKRHREGNREDTVNKFQSQWERQRIVTDWSPSQLAPIQNGICPEWTEIGTKIKEWAGVFAKNQELTCQVTDKYVLYLDSSFLFNWIDSTHLAGLSWNITALGQILMTIVALPPYSYSSC